jgi:glycosyltransferase involved in cell wall biosynthesis
VPVYNGAAHVGAALDSLLAQTFGDFELIISDNASTDATEEICRSYAARDKRVRYHRNEKNLGAAPNVSRLVSQATEGVPYFKWATHDDVVAPTHLERCVEVLDKAPSVVLAFSRRRWVDQDGRLLPLSHGGLAPSYHKISFARLLRVSPGHIPIFTWGLNRLEALKKTRLLGPYVMSDLTLAAELRLLGEFHQIPEDLYFQRQHPDRKMRRGRVEAMYLNTASHRQVVLPGLNLFYQHLKLIRLAPISARRKVSAYLAMGGYVSSRIKRHLEQGQLNRHIWDEARLMADALGLMLWRGRVTDG